MAERSIPRGRRAGALRRTLCALAVAAVLSGCEAALLCFAYPPLLTPAPDPLTYLPAGLLVLLLGRSDAVIALTVVGGIHGAGVLLMLLLWGAWYLHTSRLCLPHGQAVGRAVLRYRLAMGLLTAALAALTALLWRWGLIPATGSVLWLWVIPPVMTLLGGMALFRLCAPGTVSGRHGFFIRL